MNILILIIMLLLNTAIPLTTNAEVSDRKVVRVGRHEVPYFIEDQYGRWSGYSYDYQCKVAAYTGWDYEYVNGSWSELLGMLMNGEIDFLSDVSYLDERAEKILYSSIPMGTETYFVFTASDNTEISSKDYNTLNGKKVGVAKNSFQKQEFMNWALSHNISVDLVEMTCSEEESIGMLGNGLDAFVTMDVYNDPDKIVPVCKVGSSDFYFAVSKSRHDLLNELDSAMNQIQDEDKTYSLRLYEKYLNNNNAGRYLNDQEKTWLSEHGTIRVGYQDNYLAFCATDPDTGKLTGALKDYLEYASVSMENAKLSFEPIAFPTAAAAIEALKNGEVDCVFPANLSCYDSEQLGIVMSPPLMRTEMDAVVRASEQKEFLLKEHITVAENKGNTNYDMFLADHFPDWERVYYEDTTAALDAVAAGEADCVIISNYRFNNISKHCEKLKLATVYTGVDMDYCFAISNGNVELYSILAKVTNAVPKTPIYTSLTYYSTEDVKVTFIDLIKDNILTVMTAVIIILLVFLLLLYRGIRAEKKARKEAHIVKDLNKRVFIDALTTVRNKGAYNDYIQQLQNRLDKNKQLEFAIGVFDCDNLKEINDLLGHDKGDMYLQSTSRLITQVFAGCPVFRIGGDEFSVILTDEAYKNRDALSRKFEAQRQALIDSAESEWDKIRVAFGIAVYDPAFDNSVNDTARRADKIMYENKRISKKKQQSAASADQVQ